MMNVMCTQCSIIDQSGAPAILLLYYNVGQIWLRRRCRYFTPAWIFVKLITESYGCDAAGFIGCIRQCSGYAVAAAFITISKQD